MENQSSGSIRPGEARKQLRAARRAHDVSVRRVALPAGFILGSSLYCGAQTVAPAYNGAGHVVLAIAAMLLFLAVLLTMSARSRWQQWPRPRVGVPEATLTVIAVLVAIGGVKGSEQLATHSNSALANWGLGGAVTAIVASCLFAWNASYKRRVSRAWQR
jgi:hypothetical protein